MSRTCHLICPIQLALAITLVAGCIVPKDGRAAEPNQQEAELYGGMTLDEWIMEAKQGRNLEDRHQALQILRNHGLRRDRDKALRALTDLLSDSAPTVQSLAAAGLRKAGQPTDPNAAAKLVAIVSKDLSDLKFPQGRNGEVGAKFGLVMRAFGALEVIGDGTHLPTLVQVSENKGLDPTIRQAAGRAVRVIERRSNRPRSDSP